MIWLVPIGLLGLIGVVALIVIYIIKPNYQNKTVSSTYVWRLSLKYKKRKMPVNRLQNIIQFICQLLILTICGLLLAQPVLAATESSDPNEKVIIIDGSASMLVSYDNETRFQRAIEKAEELAKEAFSNESLVSVIFADSYAEYLLKQVDSSEAEMLYAALDELECTHGTADINGAIDIASDILDHNNDASVYLITATKYLNKNKVNVIDVSHEDDWNAAVLNVTATLNDSNYYEIAVDVGCYGETKAVTANLIVHGANGKEQTVSLQRADYFDPTEQEKRILFTPDDFGSAPLFSYDYLEVYVSFNDSISDSFTEDNLFFLYGGKRSTIKIQYASSKPNLFFGGVIRTIRQNMRDKWDIEFKQLDKNEEAATEGFDLYIFEHKMPESIPTDGIVLLVNPESGPKGSDIVVGEDVDVTANSSLASGVAHDLMQYVDSSRITIARYKEILSATGYEELAYYNGKPVILAKEDGGEKIVVWAFDVHYSNLIAIPDFSFMMYNLFNYFIPQTLESNSFEIGDTVEITGRGTNVTVSGGGVNMELEGQSGSLLVTTPGTYTVTQRPMQGDELIIENFHVHIPTEESDITKEIEELPILSYERQNGIDFRDLILWFAIALVALMLVERVIETRKKL